MEEYGRVGVFLITNCTITSNRFYQLSTITVDDCVEQTTEWQHKSEWRFYVLKPFSQLIYNLRQKQRSKTTGGKLKKELIWLFKAFRIYYESKEKGKTITIAELKHQLPKIDSAYKMYQEYLEVLPEFASNVNHGGGGFSGKSTKRRRTPDDFLISFDNLP